MSMESEIFAIDVLHHGDHSPRCYFLRFVIAGEVALYVAEGTLNAEGRVVAPHGRNEFRVRDLQHLKVLRFRNWTLRLRGFGRRLLSRDTPIENNTTSKRMGRMISAVNQRGALRHFFTWLGGHELGLMITVAALLSGIWLFALLADEVFEGDTATIDHKILLAMRTPEIPAIPSDLPWLRKLRAISRRSAV